MVNRDEAGVSSRLAPSFLSRHNMALESHTSSPPPPFPVTTSMTRNDDINTLSGKEYWGVTQKKNLEWLRSPVVKKNETEHGDIVIEW